MPATLAEAEPRRYVRRDTRKAMAIAEKEAFKELLDVIKRRNEVWYKGYAWFMKYFNLYVPLPF